jgi:hypothetical protein
MAITKKIVALATTVVAFGTMAATAFADSQPVILTDPLGGQTLPQVLTNVINFLSTTVAIPLTTIMVLVGAFQMITSAGEPEKYSKGRSTLTWAAVGFVVALLASGVTTLVSNILNGH